MGLDPDRFANTVDEELICPICGWVFCDPVQTSSCEHAFCRSCIEEWLKQRSNCPVDRQPISLCSLNPVPRILRNLLGRQMLYCENRQHGCTAVIRLDNNEQHSRECEYSPRKMVECSKGCGASILKEQIIEHNCLLDMRCLINAHENRLDECHRTISEQSVLIRNQDRQIKELEERVKVLVNVVKLLLNESSSRFRNVLNVLHNEISLYPSAAPDDDSQDLQIWSSSLPEATVTRWGGMISTPDSVIQVVIRRALVECGCPPLCIEPLMERAHERHWPPGLETLEVRQLNRRQYDNYLCRRVPGKQAVVILSLDNRHMPQDMIASPGIIMIFAHGVES